MVASGMFFFMQWSFDRGFLNYVNSQEVEQLDYLAGRLATSYARHGNWNFLHENRGTWRRLQSDLHSTAGETDGHWRKGPVEDVPSGREPGLPGSPLPPMARPDFPGAGRPDRSGQGTWRDRPPPEDPRRFGPRVVLFDANRQKVVGGPADFELNLALKPFSYENEIIGYLGLIPAKEISDAGDLLFVEQQTESFAMVALCMVVLSMALSFPLTSHLLRPIRELTRGTRKLISGRFTTRIPVTTTDELGRLSDGFNILAATLEQNEKARQQWIADISHELRTPLAVLRGEIEALQDGVRPTNSQTLAGLHGETLHLGRLVDDLYELSMSDIGALSYRKVTVDVLGIISGAVELFEQRFVAKGLRLDMDFGDLRQLLVVADPDRLQQLFANLLENSLRYTDSPGQLVVRIKKDRKSVVVSFQDSAPGIAADKMPRLFDRLFRSDGSRNRERGGAGLGLAICKNIVEAHQGNIEAANSPHGGLSIRIEIPFRM